jgi:prepilin-type processing-associated H-X9-DG protein
MLPNMEQVALFNSINWAFGSGQGDAATAVIQSTVVRSRINTMICPSASLPPTGGNIAGFSGNIQAPGDSYFGSLGSSMDYSATNPTSAPNGVIMYQSGPIGVQDVRDGSSNTIAFSEAKIGDFNNSKANIPQDVADVTTGPSGITRGQGTENMPFGATQGGSNITSWLASTCMSAQPTSQRTFSGDTWAFGIFGRGLGNFVVPPNPKTPNCITNGGGDFDNAPSVFSASSYHSGGVNVGMCDGSVRFLKDSTNIMTIWALGSRDQGETIDASSY